jgi:3-hydroxyacyl-CoA dehydrogenase
LYYDIPSKSYKRVAGSEALIILNNHKEKTVWKNAACTVYDIGDGVCGLQWKTKMNSIGSEVLEGMNKAISLAGRKF